MSQAGLWLFRSVTTFVVGILLIALSPSAVFAETRTILIPLEVGDSATLERLPVTTWSAMREATSGTFRFSDDLVASVAAHNTTTGYQSMSRAFFAFDTSSIPYDATILSARLTLTPRAVFNDYPSPASVVGVYADSGFPLNTSHAAQDYGKCGTLHNPVPLVVSAPVTELTPDTPRVFELNGDGIAIIRKAGITKFCIREGHDIENIPLVEPVAIPWKQSGASFYGSSAPAQNFVPQLEVEYSFEPVVEPPIPTGPGLVTVSIPVTPNTDVVVQNGNGIVLNTWDALRTAATGYAVSTTPVARTAVNILDSLRPAFNRYLGFDRTFMSFDLSAIPDDATIRDARLIVNVAEVYDDYLSPDATISAYPSFQYATLATTSAYSRCGDALTSPTRLSRAVHVASLREGFPATFVFENTEQLAEDLLRDWTALCLRAGYDADNIQIQDFVPSWKSVGAGIYSSFEGDPSRAPVLQVTYEKPREECCSSVVFLPGIKGSVLKWGNDFLWPPSLLTFSDDIAKLALTESGESVNPVVVDGVLEEFYSVPIYSGFTQFLDELEQQELIEDWLPFPYDWRYGPEKIIADGVQTPTGVFNVIEEIEQLALERSKTGKVTIVAHSMGGLLGKAIIKTLEEQGKAQLVESFVMVGSPQLGTPQAVAGLLHGDDEGIGLQGLYYLVHPASSRAVSQNFQSVYNLLPSRAYFETVSDSVITFDENASFTEPWRTFWGSEGINSYLNFFSFVTGAGVLREDPAINELRIPEIARGDLLLNAETFHNEYDAYEFPAHIRVVQVAGWGVPTVKAIDYRNKHFLPNYHPETTTEGDKAVVYSSALATRAEKYFFDLAVYNALEGVPDFQHRNLVTAEPIKTLIGSVIKKQAVSESSFISVFKPDPGLLTDQLVVTTHSPVILGVYDTLGNFTGINPNQDLSSQALLVTENIPGSAFVTASESQSIFLPKEGVYTFQYRGIGSGPTTVEISEFSNDEQTILITYSDIPTTNSTSVEFTVDSSTVEETELELDENGDGDVDHIIAPDGEELSLSEILELLRDKIHTLDTKEKIKTNLLKQIERLEKKIEKKKEKNAKLLGHLKKKVDIQTIRGKINVTDSAEILALVEALETELETISLDALLIGTLRQKIEDLNSSFTLKLNLLKRIDQLEKKNALINNLSRTTNTVMKKAEKGKIKESDAQEIIRLLQQIESQL